jgi:hypothetical protein
MEARSLSPQVALQEATRVVSHQIRIFKIVISQYKEV